MTLWQGNVFTSMCQDFCPRGGACVVGGSACMVGGMHNKRGMHGGGMCGRGHAGEGGAWSGVHGGGVHGGGMHGMHAPTSRYCEIWSMNGLYASYWNAFSL